MAFVGADKSTKSAQKILAMARMLKYNVESDDDNGSSEVTELAQKCEEKYSFIIHWVNRNYIHGTEANAAYLISDEGNISIVLKGKQYFVNSTDEAHAQIMEALRAGKTEDEILEVLDKASQVADYLEDSEVQIKDGCVMCYVSRRSCA
jgi:hypothetical protein